MKTAISIPDQVFKSAEKMAKKMGVSRSQLFTTAMKSYLVNHDDAQITENLNKVYSVEDSSLDPVLQALQNKVLSREKW